MKRIVINKDYGGFEMSDYAINYFNSIAGTEYQVAWDVPRDHPVLVDMVDKHILGSPLVVEEVIDDHPDFYYDIFDYDGCESVIYLPRIANKEDT